MKFNKNRHFLSPLFKSGRFYNNTKEQAFASKQSPFQTAMYLLNSFSKEVKMVVKSVRSGQKRLPKNISNWFAPSNIVQQSYKPIITWIGHSTFLIQINNKNILTDPIFGAPSIFFPRIMPPGINPYKLPKIDHIIISHNHFDHMDSKSLLFLKKQNPDVSILAPEGDQFWFKKHNFKNIHCGPWWKSHLLGDIKFTFLPAYHWSQRGIFDHNKSLWGSWMIQSHQSSIYFAGDTAYSHHFKEIAKEFKNIDFALMPVGPCEPRKYMFNTHVNAEEAGDAFLDLGASKFIPMHWGTFHFGIDSFDLPIKRIQRWWKKNKTELKNKALLVPKIGESLRFTNIDIHKMKNKHIQTYL
jgi:L-ascorbate metabolism protein UlaG (beta-lactamase superfamily)